MSPVGNVGENGVSDGSSSISLSLLERVKAQNVHAWQRLVNLYGPLIYLWCRRAGVTAEDAADVFQEVVGAVATHVSEFRRDRPGDTFRGWLWVITRNKLHDHFRSRQGREQARGGSDAHRRLAEIPDEPCQDSDSAIRVNDDALLLHHALELIRPEIEQRTWEAFWRLTVDQQSGREVADDLRMSLRAVYQAKYRVLQRLRQEMGDLFG